MVSVLSKPVLKVDDPETVERRLKAKPLGRFRVRDQVAGHPGVITEIVEYGFKGAEYLNGRRTRNLGGFFEGHFSIMERIWDLSNEIGLNVTDLVMDL
jgi:hypothetical protein